MVLIKIICCVVGALLGLLVGIECSTIKDEYGGELNKCAKQRLKDKFTLYKIADAVFFWIVWFSVPMIYVIVPIILVIMCIMNSATISYILNGTYSGDIVECALFYLLANVASYYFGYFLCDEVQSEVL